MSTTANSATPNRPKSLDEILSHLKTFVDRLRDKGKTQEHEQFNPIYQSLYTWNKSNPERIYDAYETTKLNGLWTEYFQPKKGARGEYDPFGNGTVSRLLYLMSNHERTQTERLTGSILHNSHTGGAKIQDETFRQGH